MADSSGSLVDLSDADDGSQGDSGVTDLSGGAIPDGGSANGDASGSASEGSGANASPSAGPSVTPGGAGANPHGDVVNTALSTVQDALNYGRQKYGLDGKNTTDEATPDPRYDSMRHSPDIEDRRSDTGAPTMGDTSRIKLDDVVDRGREFIAGFNPMSQQAGVNDIGTAHGAIPEEEGGE